MVSECCMSWSGEDRRNKHEASHWDTMLIWHQKMRSIDVSGEYFNTEALEDTRLQCPRKFRRRNNMDFRFNGQRECDIPSKALHHRQSFRLSFLPSNNSVPPLPRQHHASSFHTMTRRSARVNLSTHALSSSIILRTAELFCPLQLATTVIALVTKHTYPLGPSSPSHAPSPPSRPFHRSLPSTRIAPRPAMLRPFQAQKTETKRREALLLALPIKCSTLPPASPDAAQVRCLPRHVHATRSRAEPLLRHVPLRKLCLSVSRCAQ